MKKTYEKPGMYVENFSLAQSIATACGANPDSTLGKPGYANRGSCGWNMGNFIVWVENPSCNELMPEEIPFDGVCYNNPNGGTSVFTYS